LFTDIWEEESASILMFGYYNQHIIYEMYNYMFNNIPDNTFASRKNTLADMYEIPRAKKIRGYINMNSEWKRYYMNSNNWISAGTKLPKYSIKGANDFQTINKIWRKLKS
jgi:hypothetical protein